MTDIVLNNITSGYNVSKINDNFDKIENAVNNQMLHTTGGNNIMSQQLDMNGNDIINIVTNVNNPNSLLTVGAGDTRYYNVSGDTLTGQMNANGQRIINLPSPAAVSEPVIKGDYDTKQNSQDTAINANKLVSVRGQDGEQLVPLPLASSRALHVLGFDNLGQPTALLPADGSGTALALDLLNNTDPVKGSKMVGYLPAGTSAIGTYVQDKLRERVSVFDFMSAAMIADTQTGTPTLDHMPAFLLARTYAAANGKKLIVPAGAYKWNGSTTFNVDLGLFSFEGEGKVSIDCSGFTGTHVVNVYSSLTYPSAAYFNSVNKFSGMYFFGNKTAGRNGLLLGHATNQYNGQCSLYNITFAQFDYDVNCTNNTWRYSFYNCNFLDALTWIFNAPSGITNSGEVIDFYHCQLFDGAGDINIAAAGFSVNMHGCSILNTTTFISGQGVRFDMFGGNVENPGATGYYDYFNITGDTCVVNFHGTSIVMNSPTLFTDTPFKVAANSIINFIGVRFPDGSFNFDSTGKTFSFCSGAGIVMGNNCAYQPLSGGSKPNIGPPANALANGDFETGNTNGWTITTSGTGGTAVASALAARTGTYGLRMTANAATGSVIATQNINVRPGNLCFMGCYVRVNTAATTGTSLQFNFVFKDALGNTLLNAGSNTTAVQAYSRAGTSLTRYAPKGAVTCSLVLIASNGALVDVDDVVFNIM